MATAAIRYDRSAILRDAWGRARKAAAEAAEGVRSFIGAAMRGAWATAKAALAPAKLAAPVTPVQIDLVDYIAALPPVRHETRRTEHARHVMLCTRETDALHDLQIYARDPDGERLIGSVLVNADEYDDPAELLADALQFLGLEPEPTVQQPAPETEEARLTARLAELERERDEARADFIAARRERMAIVSGDMEGDAGIAWTNEERAEADYDEATDRYEEAYQDLWHHTDIAA
ncbi:hypothetical protein [Methylorubrum rhodinum]|nr:hypothetical protein [Methylorubrum rhodinum]